MTAPATALDGFVDEPARRKRLGQFFTPPALARLLAALADATAASSICDPMAGKGDMLLACLELLSRPVPMHAVEIDPRAHGLCMQALAGVTDAVVDRADSFAAHAVTGGFSAGYALTITNPPYVRYQATARAAGDHVQLPRAEAVRDGLSEIIAGIEHLNAEDRRLLQILVRSYSGLADLAVPCWLLAAAVTQPGGTLAVVVPESWLSREYAAPIKYLLLRWFDVRYVVEDVRAGWFDDALVKTNLLVATRVSRRSSAHLNTQGRGWLHVRITDAAADERSLVGAVRPSEACPELAVAQMLDGWHRAGIGGTAAGLSAKWTPATNFSDGLLSGARQQRWLGQLEPPTPVVAQCVAQPVADLLDTKPGTVSLDELGWRAGQGLRTGANAFFYRDALDVLTDVSGQAVTSIATDAGPLTVGSDRLAVVLRRQQELPPGYVIDPAALPGRVLMLQGAATPDDLVDLRGAGAPLALIRGLDALPPALADYVARAARTEVGGTLIPNLSAVRPNGRHFSIEQPDRPPRFWYWLPPLAPRHRPSLILPRVNGGTPRAFLNSARPVVVDANFTGLWPTRADALDAAVMHCLWNSVFVAAQLAVTATVMGGGALKVEAVQLGRIRLPVLNAEARVSLFNLGTALARGTNVERTRQAIDLEVAVALVGPFRAPQVVEALRELVRDRQTDRTR